MIVVYLLGKADLPLAADGVRIIPVDIPDWNRDLSPWPEEGVFRGEAFSGGGDQFLSYLLDSVFPKAEEGLASVRRYLVGYSLAGLFALYAATRTDLFEGIASCSGSLWFDGFVEYLEKHTVKTKKVFLSLGDKEKQSRNERMKRVEACTLEVEAILKKQGVETRFLLESGGHFQDVEGRIWRGIQYLLFPLFHDWS